MKKDHLSSVKKADFAVKQWQKQQPPCQQNQAHFDPVLLKPDYKLQSFGKDIIRAPSEGSGFRARSMGFRFCPHHKGDFISLCFEGFDCGLCLAKPGSLEFWVKISLMPNSGWARTVDPCTPLPHFLSFQMTQFPGNTGVPNHCLMRNVIQSAWPRFSVSLQARCVSEEKR